MQNIKLQRAFLEDVVHGPWMQTAYRLERGALRPQQPVGAVPEVGLRNQAVVAFDARGAISGPGLDAQVRDLMRRHEVFTDLVTAMEEALQDGRTVAAAAMLSGMEALALAADQLRAAVVHYGASASQPLPSWMNTPVKPWRPTPVPMARGVDGRDLAALLCIGGFEANMLQTAFDEHAKAARRYYAKPAHGVSFGVGNNALRLVYLLTLDISSFARFYYMETRAAVREVSEQVAARVAAGLRGRPVNRQEEAQQALAAALRRLARQSADPLADVVVMGQLVSPFDRTLHDALTDAEVYHWWVEGRGWAWSPAQDAAARDAWAFALVNQLD